MDQIEKEMLVIKYFWNIGGFFIVEQRMENGSRTYQEAERRAVSL